MPITMMSATSNTPAMLAMAIGSVTLFSEGGVVESDGGSVMLFPEGGVLDSGVSVEAVTVLIMMLETVVVLEGMAMGELDGSGTTLTQLEGKLQPVE